MIEYVFDHLHFKCSDLDAMVKFLVDNFGGAEAYRRTSASGLTAVVKLAGQSLLISEKGPNDLIAIDSSVRRFGLDHWGLLVKDLDAAYEDLKAKGVQFSMPPASSPTGVKYTFAIGPDNSQIELVQRG
ncbi:MAG: VOC family protein [Dehalococcoidia bacterium]|nr:VOC family protein [Dehalococcoidia bacterium]